jgi:DNA-binding MltR family transcriptional regulator
MTNIQFTDEEVLDIISSINQLKTNNVNLIFRNEKLKIKLITAQNQQKVVEPIAVPKNIGISDDYMERYNNRSNA